MPMIHHDVGRLYCTHCGHSYYASNQEVLKHPTYDTLAHWLPAKDVLEQHEFLDSLRTCPNAGKSFRFPEAVEV